MKYSKFDCLLLFYCHCHKSSPQNLLISEIQKAQKYEPFSGGGCNEKKWKLEGINDPAEFPTSCNHEAAL